MQKILVIGAGSIGQRHIQCLKELDVPDVYVCEPVEKNIQQVCTKFKISGTFSTLKQALKNDYEGTVVCVPNHFHAEVAVPVIEKKLPILLEKPVETNLAAAYKIKEAVDKHKVICQIGYCLRFSDALMYIHNLLYSGALGKIFSADLIIGQYLPDWRPGTDYRKVYSAKKNEGGGVCLDISHELDYFRWFFGEPAQVHSFVNKISNLEIDAEDIAETIVTTESGIIGRIHLDYLSRAAKRTLSIVAEKGNIEFDFITGMLKTYDADDKFWKCRQYNAERNIIYKRQLQHFMDCVKTGHKPLIDIDDSIKTLEFALSIRGD